MATVLLVDDERSVRRALRIYFEMAGFAVLEAESAEAALESIRAGASVDAIVSDVIMPGASGVALYDMLVSTVPALQGRVVFLSGAARDPGVHDPIEERGVPLLSKLDDLRLVVDAVRIALMRRVG